MKVGDNDQVLFNNAFYQDKSFCRTIPFAKHVFFRYLKRFLYKFTKKTIHYEAKNISKIKTLILDQNLFCTWPYYSKYSPSNPYIIHFNWITPWEKKIEKVKECGYWFL